MRIHEQNEVLKKQVEILLGGMNDIRNYLLSPKFYEDKSVNVNDILTRIHEIKGSYFDLPTVIEVKS